LKGLCPKLVCLQESPELLSPQPTIHGFKVVFVWLVFVFCFVFSGTRV
jgi:hypothetical protein